MKKILILRAVWVLTIILLIPNDLWAEISGPKASVERLLGEISQIETGKEISEEKIKANSKHSKTALEFLNVAEISKKALGKHWKKIEAEDDLVELNLRENLQENRKISISSKKTNPMTLAHSKAVYLNGETNVTSPYLMAETEAI